MLARINIFSSYDHKHEYSMSRCLNSGHAWYPFLDMTSALPIVPIVTVIINSVGNASESKASTTDWAYQRCWCLMLGPMLGCTWPISHDCFLGLQHLDLIRGPPILCGWLLDHSFPTGLQQRPLNFCKIDFVLCSPVCLRVFLRFLSLFWEFLSLHANSTHFDEQDSQQGTGDAPDVYSSWIQPGRHNKHC